MAMQSAESEKVAFTDKIATAGRCVEDWMLDLERIMMKSIRKAMAVCIVDGYGN